MTSTTSFWRTPQFLSLQEEWYSKLKDDGFNDIEQTIGIDNFILIKHSSNAYQNTTDKHVRLNKEQYFLLLTECVNNNTCDNDVDTLIMTKRADGVQINAISNELKALQLTPSHRETIRVIIRKYENRWGIRSWQPQQLDRNYKAKKCQVTP
jgi:hypothetical protein